LTLPEISGIISPQSNHNEQRNGCSILQTINPKTNQMKYKTFPFTITIDDGFNEPKNFKMEFDGSVSMLDLIKTLEEKFQAKPSIEELLSEAMELASKSITLAEDYSESEKVKCLAKKFEELECKVWDMEESISQK